MIAIVYSKGDPAGTGSASFIVEQLKLNKCDLCKFGECYCGENVVVAGFDDDVLYFDFLDDRLPKLVDYYIVLSRHSSVEGVKSYTVHHTGNFGEAKYGGKPRSLAVANPPVTHKLLALLKRIVDEEGVEGYDVCYEATHHGPTENSKPVTFLEIGSRYEEWIKPKNHYVVGTVVLELIENPVHVCTPVIGIGGTHYSHKHTEAALTKNLCYGHIMPKYALNHLDEFSFNLMINRSSIKPVKVIVEKKSTRREHREFVAQQSLQHGVSVDYI